MGAGNSWPPSFSVRSQVRNFEFSAFQSLTGLYLFKYKSRKFSGKKKYLFVLNFFVVKFPYSSLIVPGNFTIATRWSWSACMAAKKIGTEKPYTLAE